MNVYPALRYHDARAAIGWLCDAFGFAEKAVHTADEGTIAHAELHVPGGGVVMLSTEPQGGDPRWGAHAGQGWVYIAVENPDALHDRAAGAGAEIVMELTDTDYGSRDFSARDLEGNLWSFGTYAP